MLKQINYSTVNLYNDNIVLPNGTLVINNANQLRLHDGTTAGGNPITGGSNGTSLINGGYNVSLSSSTGILTLSTASTILGAGADPNVYVETISSSTTSIWTFGTDGVLTLPELNPIIKGAGTGTDVIIIATTGTNTSSWTFSANGSLSLPSSNVFDSNNNYISGSVLEFGNTSETSTFIISALDGTVDSTYGKSILIQGSRAYGGTQAAGGNVIVAGGYTDGGTGGKITVYGGGGEGNDHAGLDSGVIDISAGYDLGYVNDPTNTYWSSSYTGGQIRLNTRTYANTSTSTWVFDVNGNITLPKGSTLSETSSTTVITPPGAGAGQSLVIRPTATGLLTASGYIVHGTNLTITLTNIDQTGDPTGITYTITGATAEQLGIGSLTGTFPAFSPSGQLPQTSTVTLPIPDWSTATTLTLTLTGANVWINQYITVTNNGVIVETSHVHLVAGNPTTTDIYLGDDDQYIKIQKNHGSVIIGNNTNTNHWIFGTDGTLTTPGSITPNADAQYDLGSTSTRFRSAYVGTGSLFIQDISLGTNAELTVDNGLLNINGVSSFKAGSLLIANNTLTTFDTTLDINMGDPGGGDTGGINVYRNIHSVFNNLYETGGQITADTSVQVGRLLISNQPGDANAPGITITDTSVDFSLGLPNDSGKVILNRPLVRNGADGIVDLIPNAGNHGTVGTNSASVVYEAQDGTIIAVELIVTLQYSTTGDTDTEITKLLVTKNASGTTNIAVLGNSITTTAFAPATYTVQLAQGGQMVVQATTADTAPEAYFLAKSTEFGGYYGA